MRSPGSNVKLAATRAEPFSLTHLLVAAQAVAMWEKYIEGQIIWRLRERQKTIMTRKLVEKGIHSLRGVGRAETVETEKSRRIDLSLCSTYCVPTPRQPTLLATDTLHPKYPV